VNVICEKNELLKGVQLVSPVTSSKSALPILSNFLFEASKNKIKLLATDLEISAQCHIKGEVIEEGGVTIPAKRFADIIKELPEDKYIGILTDEKDQIHIKSEKSKFNLLGISRTEYPVLPEFPEEKSFIIGKKKFISMLKKTIFAASKDSERHVLNSIYFLTGDNKLKLVATDGRRLAYIETSDIINTEKQNKIRGTIVPIRAASEILRLISTDVKSENVRVGTGENRIAVEIGDVVLISTIVEGVFPNFEQVIPKGLKFEFNLNVKDTLIAVKQMALLTNNRPLSDVSSVINFCFNSKFLKISASTAGVGFGESEIAIQYEGESVDINFNPIFLKEILQSIDGEFIDFKFTDSLSPAMISPKNTKDHLCVVMPMRV
jgi:DNA polymerase-3 subunit beta